MKLPIIGFLFDVLTTQNLWSPSEKYILPAETKNIPNTMQNNNTVCLVTDDVQ